MFKKLSEQILDLPYQECSQAFPKQLLFVGVGVGCGGGWGGPHFLNKYQATIMFFQKSFMWGKSLGLFQLMINK